MTRMIMRMDIGLSREQVSIRPAPQTTMDTAISKGGITVTARSRSHHTRISKANLTSLTETKTMTCGEASHMYFLGMVYSVS